MPWDILFLLGGGFSLAESFRVTGLAEWMGHGLAGLQALPLPLLLLILCFSVTFLTEVTSNTATITVLLPILAATATVMNIHPYLLMIPATVTASFAFMLPVATPPNAIVFGSGYLTIPQMAHVGFILNILGVLWVVLMTYLIIIPVFGL